MHKNDSKCSGFALTASIHVRKTLAAALPRMDHECGVLHESRATCVSPKLGLPNWLNGLMLASREIYRTGHVCMFDSSKPGAVEVVTGGRGPLRHRVKHVTHSRRCNDHRQRLF